MTKQFIIINGHRYDTETGLPTKDKETAIEKSQHKSIKVVDVSRRTTARSSDIHKNSARSITLRRSGVKDPSIKNGPSIILSKRPSINTTIKRSSKIIRFAPHPQALPNHKETKIISEMTPITKSEPAVKEPLSVAPSRPTASEIKQALLEESSRRVGTKPTKPTKVKKTLTRKHRLAGVVSACLALILLGGYLTYIGMPQLSTRIAASQSGIDAKYPQYHPDGYSFDGPVAYQSGEINIRFKSNGGNGGYTVSQKASSWNSTAVLDNLVEKDSDGKYDISSKNGIIIYTYKNKAIWSNGGILYTINSEAPLSNEQMFNIATSM